MSVLLPDPITSGRTGGGRKSSQLNYQKISLCGPSAIDKDVGCDTAEFHFYSLSSTSRKSGGFGYRLSLRQSVGGWRHALMVPSNRVVEIPTVLFLCPKPFTFSGVKMTNGTGRLAMNPSEVETSKSG